MMLCRADFEELFPELFDPQAHAAASAPAADCLDRWEDDGGAPAPAGNRSRSWPAHAAPPMVAALFGLVAIHSAMQIGKVAMPPARRMPEVVEAR
ncbi:hypothetical protein [Sulfitobacter sp. PS-8MA]|uniref:hypothetical protein n=1 Tax=Sulfitobacter sp. PS-8MA TaxID=3237707 RepID=UPI0034C5DE09